MKTILLYFLLLISLPSFAQENGKVNWPQVRLANIETATATVAQILALPKLTVTGVPAYVVIHFSMTFTTKGQDTYGPYYTKGPALTDEEIAVMKKLTGMHTKISIEDIKVVGGDNQTRSMGSLFLTYDY